MEDRKPYQVVLEDGSVETWTPLPGPWAARTDSAAPYVVRTHKPARHSRLGILARRLGF